MVVKRKQETFAPVTLGHIRSHGCRDLLVYCVSSPGAAITARRSTATGFQTRRLYALFAPGWSALAAG
jgi:hypothetical protein